MKRAMTVLGIVLLAGVVAVPVLARGPGWGRGPHMMGYWGEGPGYCWGYGRGNANLTDDQRDQLDEVHKRFYDETSKLRDEIRTKSADLAVLLDSTDPDAEKARALQKEISELRTKLAEERVNFQLETRKIDPDAQFGPGYGRGFGPGRGRGGYGPGMGRGRHMGGYGPGMGPGWHMGGYGSGMGWN